MAALFAVADRLHMTVARLRDEMDADELLHWLEWIAKHPAPTGIL